MKTNQKGSVELIIIAVLVVALVGVVGYMFWKNTSSQDETASRTTESSQSDTVNDSDDTQTGQRSQMNSDSKYVDLRKDGKYASGVKLETVADVDKLTEIGSDLKQYFKDNVGKPVEVMFAPEKQPQTFVVDRVYGNYAEGSTNARAGGTVWGPKAGDIDVITGSQNVGYSCDELKAAQVPSVLVGNECSDGKSATPVSYN